MAVGPIGFHRVHGENISVSNNGRTARRVESFNKALCFIDRPLKAQEKLTFRIIEVSQAWSGTLRIGVTMHDPDVFQGNLPKYCCPDLNMKAGNWGKAVEEAHAVQNTVLEVYYTSTGNMMLKVNDDEPEVFLSGIRMGVPLYVLFDLYGNTQGIELLDVSLRNAQGSSRVVNAQSAAGVAGVQPLNNSTLRSTSFKNIELRPAEFAVGNTAHVQVSSTAAIGITGLPGGIAVMESTMQAGEALIVNLRELHRSMPIELALSSVTTAEIRAFKTLEDLYDQTYSVPFKTGVVTAGEEIAIVISEQGEVHVSHAGKKWLKSVHVDPKVRFRVVFDMQAIKKLSVVGITTQLQAPADVGSGGGDGSSRAASLKSLGGNNHDRAAPDCVVCLENPRDTLLKPCCHFVLCSVCAALLLQSSLKECPMCRKTIVDLEKIYMN
ncbi:neuralized protein 4-like [Tropilaelaps mercedesae]|uniref:Neuralized protein 4-like n=1 Tax=Tropilaelaps mercedesae TaxID=418985 RepID=A0A1V9X362_9ACAR|nr:neuralized protein 4-like [Tropilaelaps mercedesae]